MKQIVATERRARRLTSDEWASISGNRAFWRLVEEGFVGISQRGPADYHIRGQQYVGRAIVGDVEILVQEKVSGSLAAMLTFAIPSDVVIQRAESPAAAFDALSRALMTHFVEAAGRYIADRRMPQYEYQPAVGVSLGGSLDIPRTIRLHAKGLDQLLAFDRGRVVRDTPLDHVTLAALDEIDRAGSTLRLDPKTLYDARWLAGALDEVRGERYQLASKTDCLDAADEIAASAETSELDADLARLAAVVLLHHGFAFTPESEALVPRAWFINLEALFEQAVRRRLQQLLGRNRVDRGRTLSRRLFVTGTDSSNVNPDVVVHDGVVVHAAADVKYKSLREPHDLSAASGDPGERKKAARADLYQLLVHSKSIGARRAFLVYASDGDCRIRYHGRASTGATWTAEVRVSALEDDLRTVAIAAGLLPI